MFHHVDTIKFAEMNEAVMQTNPNGKRKIETKRQAKVLNSQLCSPSGFI